MVFCFRYFWVRDGQFLDFMILRNSVAFPQCIGFYSFGGLGTPEGFSYFLKNRCFAVVFCFRLFWLFLYY